MEITVSQAQGPVPVTIVKPHGALDASTYKQLIDKAQELYQAGTRYLLLDLSALEHMSSSGIAALQTIAILMSGENLPDPEAGWEVFHSIQRDMGKGVHPALKLLNPTANVDRVLSMVGFKKLLEVHTDLEAALASFAP